MLNECRIVIESIAKEKGQNLLGGGKDFRGTLKHIVGIWGNPSHALIELLQNADDSGANKVECKFLEKGIIFAHDGHDFTEREVKAICSVDDSTKDVEKHTGFMGIGFKAVFKISDKPHIVNLHWQFYFSRDESNKSDWGWILIPKWLDTIPEEINGVDAKTVFWLPYKNELSSDVIKQIEREIFDRLDSVCLMFLRNVREVRIENMKELKY